MTYELILNALRDCFDPEIPLNIVELGMVESVEFALDPEAPGSGIPGVPNRYTIAVRLFSGARDEALDAQLRATIHNRLAGFFAFSRITVTTAATSPWTPARITPAGRRILGLDQPRFPILNNRVR